MVGASLLSKAPPHLREQTDPSKQLKVLTRWFAGLPEREKESLAAEFKCAMAVARAPEFRGGTIHVQLLAPDTREGRMEAQVVSAMGKYRTEHSTLEFSFHPERDCIPALQVNRRQPFVFQGLPALVRRLNEIVDGSAEQVVINCTSGFRAVVPYLSAFALIRGLRVVYAFEEAAELLIIPAVPLVLDMNKVEGYLPYLESLENGLEGSVEVWSQKKPYAELAQSGLLEGDEDGVILSALGEILLARYRSEYVTVRVDKRKAHEFQSATPDILRVIAKKFADDAKRENKTETKGHHHVYDDGNNCYRIYYVRDTDGFPVIYQFFHSNHAEYERFLRNHTPPEKAPPATTFRISLRDLTVEEVLA